MASTRVARRTVPALLLASLLLGVLAVLPAPASGHGGVEPRAWETRILEDANDDYRLTEGDIDILTLDLGELYLAGVRDHMLLMRVGTRYTWNATHAQLLGLNLSFTINGEPVTAIATTTNGVTWNHHALFEAAVYTDARGDKAIYFLQTFRRLGLEVGDEFGDFRVRGFRMVNNTTLAGDRMPGFTVAPGNDQFDEEPLGWPRELPDLDRPVNETVSHWNPNNTTTLDPTSGASYTVGTYVMRGAVSFFDVTVNRTEAEVERFGSASFTVTVRNRLDFPYLVAFLLGDVSQHDWRARYDTPVVQVLPADGKAEFTFRLSPLGNGVPASRMRATFSILSNAGGQGDGELFVRLVGVPREDPVETHIEFLDLGVPPPANTYTLLNFRITNETGAPISGLTDVRMGVQRVGFSASSQHRLEEKLSSPGVYWPASSDPLKKGAYVFLDPGTYKLTVTVRDFESRPTAEFLIDAGRIPKAEGLDLPGFEVVLGLAALAVAMLAQRKRRGV